ncbi:MAG: ATPase, T2SS/T4P/T4SS family [Phycisphaeraceae bacterium]
MVHDRTPRRSRVHPLTLFFAAWLMMMMLQAVLGGEALAQPGAGGDGGALADPIRKDDSAATPVYLLSVVKPILTLLLLAGWGWVAMKLDQDAKYFHLPRGLWGSAWLGAAAVGFLLLFAVPFFIVGVLLWLIVVGGSVGGYVLYRNQKVPPNAKWSFDPNSFRQKVETFQQSQAQHRARVVLFKPNGKAAHVPGQKEPEYEAYQRLDEIVDQALDRGAQRVRIRVDTKSAASRFSIDGVEYGGPELDPQTGVRVVDYAKTIADLDVSDRRRKQSAEFKVESEEHGIHEVTLQTAGSTRGLTLTLDFDLDRRHDFTFDQIGLLATQKQQLDTCLEEKGGVVIVASPPGEGASTTLYRLLERHDPYILGVVAMEKDHTLDLEGVAVRRIDPGIPAQELQEKIASELRGDPDVVLFDFEPMPKTAELIAKSAEDIRFYLDFDQASTAAALEQWIKLVGSRKLAGGAVVAVLAQRLFRQLCTTCRVAFKPDPDRLKKLGLSPDRVSRLYRASGQVEIKGKPEPCPDCKGLGYRGRTAVLEVMALDHQARTYIAAGEMDRLKGHLRKQKMMYLQEAALARVAEGATDIKEVTRVLEGDNSKKSSSKSSAKPSATSPNKPSAKPSAKPKQKSPGSSS